MAFCSRCSKSIDDGTTICASCVAKEAAATAQLAQLHHLPAGVPSFAWLVFFVSAILVLFGGYRAFVFDDANKIVGGDAYNYLLFLGQGIVLIGAGIFLALLGIASTLASLLDATERPLP
jgi:hypothetical protein